MDSMNLASAVYTARSSTGRRKSGDIQFGANYAVSKSLALSEQNPSLFGQHDATVFYQTHIFNSRFFIAQRFMFTGRVFDNKEL